jgi:2-polyprenyl-3-methyl-5-hydroxy-6-metoxy-1,4-benzoquinol methylase
MSPASTRGQHGYHPRSAARTAVVWAALQEVLDAVPDSLDAAPDSATGDRTASVVDIGGGTGGFAVRVAELGHDVTVIDPSPDALATLVRRAEESGVADRVTGRQGDLASLLEMVQPGTADVLLGHGVLEIVEDPAASLRVIAQAMRPGGTLSLLVSQRHAAVVARAMAGHFTQAKALLDDPTGGGVSRRFGAEELAAVLDAAGFATTAMHAVRVFVDLVPSSLVDLEPGADAALVELEQAVADRPEYLSLATQIHALATRL